jgi:hypothetical protein
VKLIDVYTDEGGAAALNKNNCPNYGYYKNRHGCKNHIH